MWIVVIIKADRGMIYLAEVIELVESAFKKLPMHEENFDPFANLDDL